MPRNMTKHVKAKKGGGRRTSGKPVTDKVHGMTGKDASSGEQRYVYRTKD